MDVKDQTEYEDITFDDKEDDAEEAEEVDEESEESSEPNELQAIAVQLSKDYAKYFQFDISQEKKETEDAVEDLLTHLEEFCGLIEMIRNDNNICLDEVQKNVSEKSQVMNEIYTKIDKLEQFVQIVKQSVDDMDKELTQAEQLFGDSNNNKVKKFFSAFISNTSKQTPVKRINAKYEPKEIFRTSDYIKSCDLSHIPHHSGQSHQSINGSLDSNTN